LRQINFSLLAENKIYLRQNTLFLRQTTLNTAYYENKKLHSTNNTMHQSAIVKSCTINQYITFTGTVRERAGFWI
jgi:hypothetical protein